jgi:hypothetical protein
VLNGITYFGLRAYLSRHLSSSSTSCLPSAIIEPGVFEAHLCTYIGGFFTVVPGAYDLNSTAHVG